MMTTTMKSTTPEENCVVRAVAFMTEQTPAKVIEHFDAVHEARDWYQPGIGVTFEAMAVALSAMRWKLLVPKDGEPFVIPSRALIDMEGHVFAVSHGRIFDTAPGCAMRDGELFMVFVPPEPKQ